MFFKQEDGRCDLGYKPQPRTKQQNDQATRQQY